MKPLITLATALLLTAVATTTALMADTLATAITAKTGTIDLQLTSVTTSCGKPGTSITYTATKAGNTYTVQINVDPPGNSKDNCTVELLYKNTGSIPIKIYTSTAYSNAASCSATPQTTDQLHPGDEAAVTISITDCQGSCTCTAESTARSWNQ